MAAGIYNTTIDAGRNYVRRLRWTDKVTGEPIPLDDYVRVVYNVQTKTTPIVEVISADSDINPTWIYIEDPAADGYIRISIPGNQLPYIGSANGLYEHELVLIDASGGPTPLFKGEVTLEPPIVDLT